MLCFALYVLLRFQHIPWCSGRVCYQRFLEVRTPFPFLDIPAASPNRYAALLDCTKRGVRSSVRHIAYALQVLGALGYLSPFIIVIRGMIQAEYML